VFLSKVVGVHALATAWPLRFRQGPLEKIVAVPSTRARQAVARLLTLRHATASTWRPRQVWRTAARGATQVLAPVACAGVLALAFWAGARLTAPPDRVAGAGAGGTVSDGFAAGAAVDVDRYCQLSEQLSALSEAHPDEPRMVVAQGTTLLDEMPRVAPFEIRDAVSTVVEDYRAQAEVPGVVEPQEGSLQRAEATVDTFEDRSC
jgi:hypothetical protein